MILNNVKGIEEVYCDNIYQQMKNFNIEEYFKGKIEQKKYFNKCELEYISQFYHKLYDNALASRNAIIEENRKRRETEQREILEHYKNEVLKVNQKFKEDYKRIVEAIISKEEVKNINFEFYKDDKYENGITTQNCFLYLAKKHQINIPLATQGFINNKLEKYNFESNRYSFWGDKRHQRGSTKIYEYFSQIYEKVKNEFGKENK